MADLRVEVEPRRSATDADRLRRIDSHFARPVDDGRLPGWLAVVAGIAHIAHSGHRDVKPVPRSPPTPSTASTR